MATDVVNRVNGFAYFAQCDLNITDVDGERFVVFDFVNGSNPMPVVVLIQKRGLW